MKEFDKLSDRPFAPFSDRATRQRDRCRFPRGGGNPRPIANRLQHGNEADFPIDLAVVMRESAAKKARRIVIGRTLGGRATFKALFDCLKLHLPAPFNSVSLLTRGYFEVLFENEEGAKATRRLAAIEWSGLGLSFSRYIPNFDSSSQGGESSTHTRDQGPIP